MVSSAELIETISEKLKFIQGEKHCCGSCDDFHKRIKAPAGRRNRNPDKQCLLRQAVLVTPNIPRRPSYREYPLQMKRHDESGPRLSAKNSGAPFYARVGTSKTMSNDLLYMNICFNGSWGAHDNKNTHGNRMHYYPAP
jgi:hypothetical protein